MILDNRFIYPNLVLDTIEKFKATGFAGVPSHYAMLLNASDISDRKLQSLKYFLQAGDRMPEEVTGRILTLFPRKKIYLMYGQTEASPRLTYLDPKFAGRKPGSVGKAISGVKVKVVNGTGRTCRAREEGEIIAKGDNVMLGYWRNKRETAKVIKNGWLHTGDTGFTDEDGDLYITGRKRNFIKVGGHRVNPREIEDLVKRHINVTEAAVVDIPDGILGRKIKLFVASAHDNKLSVKDILRICMANLPIYKVPSKIVILKSIPTNNIGKIDRDALRAM